MSKTREVLLLPAPREIKWEGDGFQGSAPEVSFRLAPELPAQGFELRVAASGVEIRHADAEGQRYAEATLEQLKRQFPDALPGLQIRDWPDFPVRGFMLDVSRDRVPTRETLDRLVRLLALLRINHFELYTEHTFAYREHRTVWEKASPITPEDIGWLDSLCCSLGIELVANQNGFGHMGRWLEHPHYRDRAEAPNGWEAPWGGQLAPGVLAPTKDNAEFVLSLMRELLPCFTSRQINIGCDETFELGQGRSQEEVDRRGSGPVYVEYLQRLLKGLHADGHPVLFWGDIVRQHPELVSSLPRENTTALVWHYEAPVRGEITLTPDARKTLEAFGMTEATLRGFAGHVAPFVEHGFPYWVCPGTSTWNTLIGRLPNALENMLDAVEIGLKEGAGGVLITDWGDNGHMAPPSVSFLPLCYGASVAWCQASNRELELTRVLDTFVFEDSAREIGSVLDQLGRLHALPGLQIPNGSPLQFALIRDNILARFEAGTADEAGIAEVLEQLREAEVRIQRSAPQCVDGDLVRRELVQAIRMARHGAWRISQQAGFSSPGTQELERDLESCIEGQRACWLARSRPGGLDDSIARITPVVKPASHDET